MRWTTQAATRMLAGLAPGARMARDELIVHTMARTLDRCDRTEQVRKALIGSIAQLTGSSEIQWVREANQNSLGETCPRPRCRRHGRRRQIDSTRRNTQNWSFTQDAKQRLSSRVFHAGSLGGVA